jgi:two-component system response regulator LytT
LKVAVDKFQMQLSKKEPLLLNFEQIRSMFAPSEKIYKSRFTVKIGLQLKIINSDEIECFFSENKGTYIHTFENRDYLIDTPLEVLEEDLCPKNWYRISRKFIVPLASVKEILVYSNSRLKIILPTFKGEDVIVSREKVSDFKNWMA